MEVMKIKLEFVVDVSLLKKVLKARGLTVNVANMKRMTNIYKTRQYSIKDISFFDDFPKDKETLLTYGFKFEK